MTLKDNIKRQSVLYIEAVLAGMEGDMLRTQIHQEFCRYLPEGIDPDFLQPVLHNLDQAIGFTLEMVGKQVPKNAVQHWGEELFKLIWRGYETEGSK